MVRQVRSCAVISRMPFHIELFWAGEDAVLNLSTMLAAVASNLRVSCGLLPWASTDTCRSSRWVRRSCSTHIELSFYPENFLRGACTLVTHRPLRSHKFIQERVLVKSTVSTTTPAGENHGRKGKGFKTTASINKNPFLSSAPRAAYLHLLSD